MIRQNILLIGIGNLLWADEGFGVRVVEQLLKNYVFPENVTVIDGGTQGIYLVEHVQQADILIVFDAIEFGFSAGSLHQIHGDDVPNFLGAKKMSLHQTGFQEVLAMAKLLGDYPKHLLLIGVQPVELEDFGGSLQPEVKAQIQPAISIALDYLQAFGVEPIKTINTETLIDPMLDITRYENDRPSEIVACRMGDERVIFVSDIKIIPPMPLDDAVAIPVDFRGQY